MPSAEFKVDLEQLRQAIGSVAHESRLIDGYMNLITGQFTQVKGVWSTPSEASFEEVHQWFTRVQKDLHLLLEETVRRMQKSYDNYHAAEISNVHNVNPGG